MWRKKNTTEEKVKLFSEEIIKELNGELESLMLYGSVAKDEHVEGVSDINFLIVVNSVSFEILLKIGAVYRKFEKENFALPLVVDQTYIRTSLDVFPIEFMEMKENSRLIHGVNPFEGSEFSLLSLRLEVERELKGKLLSLRQGIMRFYGSENFSDYLFRTLKSFKIYVETSLKLTGIKHEGSFNETISIFSEKLNIKADMIMNLWEKYKKQEPVRKDEVKALTRGYLSEIEAFANAIDRFEMKN